MQINGAHIAPVFVKNTSEQDKIRSPIIIDGKSGFKLEDESSVSLTADIVRAQDDIVINDQQQSRFVRLFSIENESGRSFNQPLELPSPKSIKQYEQVAELPAQITSQYIDEIV